MALRCYMRMSMCSSSRRVWDYPILEMRRGGLEKNLDFEGNIGEHIKIQRVSEVTNAEREQQAILLRYAMSQSA